ncbi:MAG: ATP-dependent Clp protease adapter ClpS [Xanthomonadales bacterium]|jgi:ATP-dependent Clp protease adaptor protein ClpS|nr:ATP-dependent Clp protease adapter ClpS [Xanthomonadales bacterium]
MRSPDFSPFLHPVPPRAGDDPPAGDEAQGSHSLVIEPVKTRVGPPPMWQVLLLNDDFTPMEFVVDVLKTFFGMNHERATQVMLHVHTRGKGLCGVYTREVAETKVQHVNEYSRAHQHPLMCSMEKA